MTHEIRGRNNIGFRWKTWGFHNSEDSKLFWLHVHYITTWRHNPEDHSSSTAFVKANNGFQDEFFRVMTPCNVVIGDQRFGGPWCLHLQGEVEGNTNIINSFLSVFFVNALSNIIL
jgi:hypothetical protein